MFYVLCSSCHQPCNTCSCSKVNADNVTYTGPTLPCFGIETNDSLTVIIQKLNYYFCPTTTTSTTTIANCEEWEAIIFQTSTNTPEITLINSTLGEDYIEVLYVGVGKYLINFINPNITLAYPIYMFIGNITQGAAYLQINGPNSISIDTVDFNSVYSDDILVNSTIYIKKCTNLPPTPTTTITTTTIPVFVFNFNDSTPNPVDTCSFTDYPITLYTLDAIVNIGTILYDDISLTIPFNGADNYHRQEFTSNAYQIDAFGVVSNITACT